MAIKTKTHRECANPDCGKVFKKFSSLDKYCSRGCMEVVEGKKQVKKVSDKRKVENEVYSQLRKVFLSKPENKICPITGKPTTDVHHKSGRSGSNFLDVNTWLAVSREGHQKIELNPEWAKEMGYSLNRI